MKAINAYLNFDGQTREAMTFYAKVLGAKLEIPEFENYDCPVPEWNDRVLHARLSKGDLAIMASDTPPGVPVTSGNNFHVCIDCDDVSEIERLFNGFSDGGKVGMPLQDMFWGARFGTCTDKYGVNWMFNCYVGAAQPA